MKDTNESTTMIERTLELLKSTDEVTELRILKTQKGTVSGYFDNHEALANAVVGYDGKVPGVYITLNPVQRELLARASNRAISWAKNTTTDADIESRKWLPIDFDPIRASNTSSTNKEHQDAKELAEEVSSYLKEQGWSEPIVANSGNGYHLLYSINLPNNHENTALIQSTLQSLDLKFSNDKVDLDTSTYNASRIWKLYGTMSCKGDHTEERPHRLSSIISYPEVMEEVSKQQLQSIADHIKPLQGSLQNMKQQHSTSFKLDEWLTKHGITVAYQGEWQQKSTKYVLETCPWKEEHTDRSAFLIQFKNGAIAAGCHHNSCSEEDWHSLRKKYEPNFQPAKVEKEAKEETQSELLIRLGSEADFFTNELEEAFAAVEINGHTELWKVKSRNFKMWLTKKYYDETGKAPMSDAMNQSMNVMEMKAMFEGKEHRLNIRVAEKNDKYYYDLVDKDWRVVEITSEGCNILADPPILFTRNKNMKAQVEPDFEGDIKLLLNHIRLKNEEDGILYLAYIVSCLIPTIPHPVLVFSGEKGASKSTSMRMTRQIVDPAVRDLLTMPNGLQDLAISLANNYMPCFDNLDSLSAAKSDLLCLASTGGSFSKRTLYSDDDETLLELKRCTALNGINVVVTRADLMDRSILLELERIPEDERKEESTVWSAFDKDKPSIIGGALQTLSRAMEIYPDVKLDKLSRMADFTKWGYAIAEAMGYGGERFLEAYSNNQRRSNEEAIYSHPVAAAMVALMRRRSEWVGTVTSLLHELEFEAHKERINTNIKSWPKASHVLSRRLKEVKSNLEGIGITFDIRHTGNAKRVTIINKLNENDKDNITSLGEGKLNLRVPGPDEIELTPSYDELEGI